MPRDRRPPNRSKPRQSADAGFGELRPLHREEALGFLRECWKDSLVENAAILHGRGEPLSWRLQHFPVGGDHHIAIDRRAVLTAIARYESEAIVLMHFHPTGDPSPSRADTQATREIAQLCRMLRVTLYDHIIIAPQSSFSFRDAGLL